VRAATARAPTTTDLDRIVAHLCAVEDAVAERTETLPWGTAVFHARVPWVREVNMVRVETTVPRRSAGEIAFAAEQRFPQAPAVEVLHEPSGAALAPAFAAAGWQVGRHLLMARERPPPDAPTGSFAHSTHAPARLRSSAASSAAVSGGASGSAYAACTSSTPASIR